MNRASSGSFERPSFRDWARFFAGRPQGEQFHEQFQRIVQGMGRPKVPSFRIQRGIVYAVLALILLARSFVIIPYGETGVVFSAISGVLPHTLGEGFHPIIPFIHKVTPYDTKVRTYIMSHQVEQGDVYGEDQLQALTADGQRIDLDITVQYRLAPENLPKLHDEIGPTYARKIIRAYARSNVRMVCAQHPVRDYTSEARYEIESQIESLLSGNYESCYIQLVDVIIGEVEFSQEFKTAVEEKQQALQEAEQLIYRIQEAENEARRELVAAEGDAASIAERGRALQRNPLLIRYEYIEKIAPNVGGILTTSDDIDRKTSPGTAGVTAASRPPEVLSFDDLDLTPEILREEELLEPGDEASVTTEEPAPDAEQAEAGPEGGADQ